MPSPGAEEGFTGLPTAVGQSRPSVCAAEPVSTCPKLPLLHPVLELNGCTGVSLTKWWRKAELLFHRGAAQPSCPQFTKSAGEEPTFELPRADEMPATPVRLPQHIPAMLGMQLWQERNPRITEW